MKIVFSKRFEFDHCGQECPYFSMVGGPGPIPNCNHPQAKDGGYILKRFDEDFPEKCPLKKGIEE